MVNNPKRQWYQVKNAASDGSGVPEILIYGEIDSYFGVSAANFVRDLAAIDAPAINVRINSPGGDVFDAVAILNALRGHSAKVTTIIDGIAASAASVIAMGGDEVVMNTNSQMMIHNAWAVSVGDATDMQKTAEMLARQNANIAAIYAGKAGGSVDDWLAAMDAETWMNADETVACGLADMAIVETIKNPSGTSAAASFDLSKFRYPGREAAPVPQIAARAQVPEPAKAEVEKRKEPTVAALSESALQKLGLDADADESAIDEAIEKLATPAEPASPAEPTIDEATKVAAKFGMTVVNSAQWDQAQAQLADLTARAAAQTKAENEAAISDALTSGRIDAKSADTWRGALAQNREGTLSLLATLPANKAVPVDEIGHGVSREDQPEDEGKAHAYAQITGRSIGKDA